jgi:hypothetical protein
MMMMMVPLTNYNDLILKQTNKERILVTELRKRTLKCLEHILGK